MISYPTAHIIPHLLALGSVLPAFPSNFLLLFLLYKYHDTYKKILRIPHFSRVFLIIQPHYKHVFVLL